MPFLPFSTSCIFICLVLLNFCQSALIPVCGSYSCSPQVVNPNLIFQVIHLGPNFSHFFFFFGKSLSRSWGIFFTITSISSSNIPVLISILTYPNQADFLFAPYPISFFLLQPPACLSSLVQVLPQLTCQVSHYLLHRASLHDILCHFVSFPISVTLFLCPSLITLRTVTFSI